MKKGNLLVCAMLVMCQLSLAQVSRDSAYEFLKTNILPNDWEDKEINIYVSPNLVPENSVITALGIGFDTFAISPNYKTWFFYVDEEPISQWHRKCKYVFINDENNFIIIDMTTPPNYTGMIPLHTITPRFIEADTSSWKKRKKPKNKNVSANDYAVIISGGYLPVMNWVRYWNDCSAMYKSLIDVYNYEKNKIFVIMADGTGNNYNSGTDLNPIYIPQSLDLDNDGTNDIQYAATKSNIAMVFDTLKRRVTSNDNVVVFVTDHGDQGSKIALWNSVLMTKSEFADEIEKIKHAKTINLLMSQCYSGGYKTLANDNIVVTVACDSNEKSYPMSNMQYDEFCYHWISAVARYLPDDTGTTVNSDINNDGYISVHEAYLHAANADTQPLETPQYFSPENPYLAAYLTLNGQFDMDLYIRDSINDNGNEPTNVKYMYNSPDIWIGDSDGNPVDNIYGGGSYYVCVRIHNKRAVSSTSTERLIVNWAKAGIDLPWPSGWDGEEDKDIG